MERGKVALAVWGFREATSAPLPGLCAQDTRLAGSRYAPGVLVDPGFWSGRRVLVTGHTGFKGAWLSLWLQLLGAEVHGFSGDVPTEQSLYEAAGVGRDMDERLGDVRDGDALAAATRAARPQTVFHLAAQPMVRRSLREPRLTYEVNVMGTVNALEAVRGTDGVETVVVVTSDKCYDNDGPGSRRSAFREADPLGGHDPYSSSKACAELVTAAYRDSFFAVDGGPRVASVRAGNVIGGGDWGEDRLVPDLIRAAEGGEPVRLRNPDAVRPWQHVLNPLSGYLLLAQRLGEDGSLARAWNFGPPAADAWPVRDIVAGIAHRWPEGLEWTVEDRRAPSPEAAHLEIDSSAAREHLGWAPGWDLDQALSRIVEWHVEHARGDDMRRRTLEQIGQFPA